MKLSEMIKTGIEVAPKNFHHETSEIDGKQITKYTLDFIREGEEVIVEENAKWYRANETMQLTVPMPVLSALKMDKSFASRRWLKSDITEGHMLLAAEIRGTSACMALDLELAKLKVKMYNKAKAASMGAKRLASDDKSIGLTSMVIKTDKLDVLLGKIDAFDKDVTGYFTSDHGNAEVIEEY